MKIQVSIIIPLYLATDELNKRFLFNLKKYSKLKHKSYELLLVSDKKISLPELVKTRVIYTGKGNTGPAEKRDLALKYAKGKYCAFIDDDAYPHPGWLTAAMKNFVDKRVAAVGGPGVTPKEDGYWQQLTGLVYESYFCGGAARHRFIPEKMRFVEDYPAYNLIVRRDVLKRIGGYGSYFYGGEDTFLCLKIVRNGFKIIYDPDVLVYHHRRPLFVAYLKQIANIGLHRGYFAKKFPETSFIPFYFLPSTLSIGFFVGMVLAFFDIRILVIYLSLLILSFVLGFLSVISKTNYVNAAIVAVGIIMTHLTYGIYFIKGLFTPKLAR